MQHPARWLAPAVLVLAAGPAFAAAPSLNPLGGQGLRTGAATTLVLDGADLLPDPRLILPVPVTATVKPGATANRVEVELRLAADVPPGIYPLRVATSGGISGAVALSVDTLPTVVASAALLALPVAVRGAVPGGETVRVTFAGAKGQRVVAEVEARRIGSQLDPSLELLDPRGVPVASAMGRPGLHGDARLVAVLPADGTYAIDLRDALYQANPPSHFRLKIGDLAYADSVLPLGAKRGSKVTPEFVGHLPAKGFVFDVPAEGDEVPALRPVVPGLTGDAPRLALSPYPEEVEAAQPSPKLQIVPAPGAVSGRIAAAGEQDRYRFAVSPGMRLRFDVFAARLGSPLDAVLTVTTESGELLAEADDRPDSVDATLERTVPANTTAVIATVADAQGRGGPEFVYRLAVTPAAEPDFALAVAEDRVLIPKGGAAVLRVQATRTRYDGPILLKLLDAPPGVVLENATIPSGSLVALVTVRAEPGAALAQRLVRLVGYGGAPLLPFARPALVPETPLSRGRSWLRRELGLAVTDPGPLSVAWGSPASPLRLGGPEKLPVKVERRAGATGVVKLSLVTNQVVPKKPDNTEDPNRALRIEGAPTIAAEKSEGVVTVTVPRDLPRKPVDVYLKVELLGPNGMATATAVTPVRRLNVMVRLGWLPRGL